MFTNAKNNDRLAQLWDDLRADALPPHPATIQPGEIGMLVGRHDAIRTAARIEPVAFVAMDLAEPVRPSWKVDLKNLFHNLLELEGAESSLPAETLPDVSVETDHEIPLSVTSPFRWEPKPVWLTAPAGSSTPLRNFSHPRRFPARPKIPSRPLHKQPLYMRILFCLRRWLSG